MWSEQRKEEFKQHQLASRIGGGMARYERQHEQGKLTARERIDLLFDPGTFVEVGALREARPNIYGDRSVKVVGDGVIVGYGKVNGRAVYASSEDFTVNGGSLGEVHSSKICECMDMAMRAKAPFVSINDSGGARIDEGVCSLSGYSGMFLRNTMASGVIPQIAVILGPCAGGACYSPAICDFIFMTRDTAKMFITGPAVVKAVTREEVTFDDLGGATMHSTVSGCAHFVYRDDRECIMGVRELLSYLPQNNQLDPPRAEPRPVDRSAEIESIVPDDTRQGYDVRDVVRTFADGGEFVEVHEGFAKSVVVGLCRLDGRVIGVVANQPSVLAGSLDVDSSDKAARLVRFCDCFNIPILSLVDVPGYFPGASQEHAGIIRHGAKLLFAYAEATVPKVSLIMRKAYGGAYIAMNSKRMGADYVFAWPIAEIAVMGAEGAVDILHRREIKSAADPEAARAEFAAEYEDKHLNPYFAAANGLVDEVISPEETRRRLAQAFESLKYKKVDSPWKKHGNIPL
ncbi:MAG TPA: methylmalonyl-CoA carboxyltransferase [Eggerthellaceae bacterium]|nr:methylmalonyl-CoA carboxyltransferase [Eggerthellaceae bacterium]